MATESTTDTSKDAAATYSLDAFTKTVGDNKGKFGAAAFAIFGLVTGKGGLFGNLLKGAAVGLLLPKAISMVTGWFKDKDPNAAKDGMFSKIGNMFKGEETAPEADTKTKTTHKVEDKHLDGVAKSDVELAKKAADEIEAPKNKLEVKETNDIESPVSVGVKEELKNGVLSPGSAN